jgi:hypothetical protein
MTDASSNSPVSGESVSDVSPVSDGFEEFLADEVIECRQLLRECVHSDADLDGIAVRVREARARLRLLERAAERGERFGQ